MKHSDLNIYTSRKMYHQNKMLNKPKPIETKSFDMSEYVSVKVDNRTWVLKKKRNG